jgi:hypothetical protein
MSDFYILDDDHNLIATDVMTWGEWFGTNGNRIVAKTVVGDAVVSTVCLGLDHNFYHGGPPLLFETMIFGGEHDEECWRCSTWDEAEAQHARVVADLDPYGTGLTGLTGEPFG